jgi:hypothetical protein
MEAYAVLNAQALPLERARVCLDCDCLTDSPVCPWCARDRTVIVSRWLRPLDRPSLSSPERDPVPEAEG